MRLSHENFIHEILFLSGIWSPVISQYLMYMCVCVWLLQYRQATSEHCCIQLEHRCEHSRDQPLWCCWRNCNLCNKHQYSSWYVYQCLITKVRKRTYGKGSSHKHTTSLRFVSSTIHPDALTSTDKWLLFYPGLSLACATSSRGGSLDVFCEAKGGKVTSVTCNYDNGAIIEPCRLLEVHTVVILIVCLLSLSLIPLIPPFFSLSLSLSVLHFSPFYR